MHVNVHKVYMYKRYYVVYTAASALYFIHVLSMYVIRRTREMTHLPLATKKTYKTMAYYLLHKVI